MTERAPGIIILSVLFAFGLITFIPSIVIPVRDGNPDECDDDLAMYNIVQASVPMGLVLIGLVIACLSGTGGLVALITILIISVIWNLACAVWGTVWYVGEDSDCRDTSVGKLTLAMVIIRYLSIFFSCMAGRSNSES